MRWVCVSSSPRDSRPLPTPATDSRQNNWSAANVFRALCIAFAVFYAIKLVGAAIAILFAGFLGILFGLNLSAFADALQRRRIPRSVTVTSVVVVLFATLGVGAMLLGPRVSEQAKSLRKEIPQALNNIDAQLRRVGIDIPMPKPSAADSTSADSTVASPATGSESTAPTTASNDSASALQAHLSRMAESLAHSAMTVVSSTLSALTGAFIVMFVAVFYAIEPNVYRDGFLHLIPHARRQRVGETMAATGDMLRNWLRAQLMAMLCIGVVSSLAYWAIGLKAPIALGMVAGILEFVPFVGPVAAAVVAVGVALGDSPEKVLYVVLASAAIQQAEEMLIVPLLMKKNLTVPPILTILTQGVLGVVFGIIGILVAVPLLAAVIVAVRMLYVEDVIGDDLQPSASD
jgi:predicted PurR-regulated permease PerM